MNISLKDLFEQLMTDWNIRGIQIGDIQLYAINDLPIDNATIRSKLRDIKKNDPYWLQTHLFKISPSNVCSTHIRNFETVANRGENFGDVSLMNFIILSSQTIGFNYKTKVCDLLMSIMQNGYHLEASMNEFQLAKAEQQIKVMKKKFKLLCIKDLSIPVIASGLYGTSAKKLYDSLIDLEWLSTDKYGNKKVENKKYLQMIENNRLVFTPEGFNEYRLKFPTLKYELAGVV